ncbi:MAG: erythromycin esterase family protein [Saprospiraceae bacterium]|nr:erythromycin esterase family protein [Saprospiraceae bacterium]
MPHIVRTLIILCIAYSPLFGQLPTDAHIAFVQAHALPINIDLAGVQNPWNAVIREVRDKHLVMLGEFNHGSREVFEVRNALIKALHAELGIDLILFESGLGEVGVIDRMKDTMPGAQLTSGFFGGWRNDAFQNLLEYARDQGIRVGGFDVQRTGHVFTDFLADQLTEPQALIDLEEQFVKIKGRLSNYRTEYEAVRDDANSLIAGYRELAHRLGQRDPLISRTLENRVTYLEYMVAFAKQKDWHARWRARDKAMAQNVQWLLDQAGDTGKVLVIAHNFHIARHNDTEYVMGEYLAPLFGKQMYAIGVFAAEGEFHNNSGQVESMSPPDTGNLDIKHIIQADRAALSFLPIPAPGTPGSGWLFRPVIVRDTFIDLTGSETMVLGTAFDALLLLDRVSPPVRSDIRR